MRSTLRKTYYRGSYQTRIGALLNYVSIGLQAWLKKNTTTVITAMGNTIPEITSDSTWATAQTLYTNAYTAASGTEEEKKYAGIQAAAMWSNYNNDDSYLGTYGRYYNWWATVLINADINYYNISNPNHPIRATVPTESQWIQLSSYLGGNAVSGGKLKEEGTVHWVSPNLASNESRFTALPGSRRSESGTFGTIGIYAQFAVLNENTPLNQKVVFCQNTSEALSFSAASKMRGFSLRMMRSDDLYVVYTSNGGGDLAGLFEVYARSKDNSRYYIKYSIEHVVDATTRTNLWRIVGADLYEINVFTNELTTASKTLLTNGENEFAYKEVGKTDFAGGFHGDEELVSVVFRLDGKNVSLGNSFSVYCRNFSYSQNSEIFEVDEVSNIVQSELTKSVVINSNSATIDISNKIKASITIDYMYNTLVSTFFDVSEYYKSENESAVDVTNGAPDTDVLYGNARHHETWSDTNSLRLKIDSEFDNERVGAFSRVWARAGVYNKLYISSVPRNYEASVDEIFASKTVLTFIVEI